LSTLNFYSVNQKSMADDFVANKLSEWGLEALMEVFRDEAIDAEALKILDDETINNIVKKSGLKLKLKVHLKEFQRINAWVEKNTTSATTLTLASHSSGISVQELAVTEDGQLIPVEEIEKPQVSQLLNSAGKVYLLILVPLHLFECGAS
jgi:hypothetical protein